MEALTLISPWPSAQHACRSLSSSWYLVIRCTGLIRYAASGCSSFFLRCTLHEHTQHICLMPNGTTATQGFRRVHHQSQRNQLLCNKVSPVNYRLSLDKILVRNLLTYFIVRNDFVTSEGDQIRMCVFKLPFSDKRPI